MGKCRAHSSQLLTFSAVIPVAAATMTPLPLLALLIVVKIRDVFSKKKELIPINDDDDCATDIIKTKIANDVKESESQIKLVNNGDANENNIA